MGIELLAFLSVGVIAGILAGMFGIGGGVIIVPALIATFMYLGFDENIITHLAIGTSLSCILFTGIASTYSHNKKQGIIWQAFYPLSVGIFFGAILGAVIANNISGVTLRSIVGIFLLFLAIEAFSTIIAERALCISRKEIVSFEFCVLFLSFGFFFSWGVARCISTAQRLNLVCFFWTGLNTVSEPVQENRNFSEGLGFLNIEAKFKKFSAQIISS